MHNIFEDDFRTGSFLKKLGKHWQLWHNYSSLGKFPVSTVLLNSAFKVSGELFLRILKSLRVYL